MWRVDEGVGSALLIIVHRLAKKKKKKIIVHGCFPRIFADHRKAKLFSFWATFGNAILLSYQQPTFRLSASLFCLFSFFCQSEMWQRHADAFENFNIFRVVFCFCLNTFTNYQMDSYVLLSRGWYLTFCPRIFIASSVSPMNRSGVCMCCYSSLPIILW